MLRLDRSIKFLMDSLYEPWLVKPGNDSFKVVILSSVNTFIGLAVLSQQVRLSVGIAVS